jgi:hypothetical protein
VSGFTAAPRTPTIINMINPEAREGDIITDNSALKDLKQTVNVK